jgi:predicted RNase H-like HicB family nuclease
MDSVRIEKQPDGTWLVHIPGIPDIFLDAGQLSDLIARLDEIKTK